MEIKNKTASTQLSRWVKKQPISKRLVDLTLWKIAFLQAKNIDNPDRTSVLQIYDDILIDSHLTSNIETRVLKLLHSKFNLYNAQNKPDIAITRKFNARWFQEFLRHVINSIFMGHSLIELNDFDTDRPNVELINRFHVIPEFNVVKKELTDSTGISYIDPTISDYYIGIGERNELGVLFKAAPLVIAKKYNLGSWAEFNEKFGIPFRAIFTPFNDDTRLGQLGEIMGEMGGAGYAVLKEGEKIEFHEANNSASSTFEALTNRLNREISKLILGQTGTTEHGESGTYGSIKVMQDVAQDRHNFDKTIAKYVINDELLPRLERFGFISKGYYFDWDETKELNPKEYVEMITTLNQNYNVPAEFVAEKTGIPVEKKEPETQTTALPKTTNVSNLSFYQERKGQKKKSIVNETQNEALKKIEKNLLNDVYNGKSDRLSPEYFEWLTNTFMKGINMQFKTFSDEPEDFDHALHASFEANIFNFSAAKDFATVQKLNNIAKKAKNYNEFLQASRTLLDDYNANYMQTEYNTATSTAIGASRYYELQSMSEELPYWEYRSAGDDRVREAHSKLNRMIFRADDDIWDTIYPPNGWNCRCEVIAHADIPKGQRLNQGKEAIQKLQNTQISKKETEWDLMSKTRFNKNRANTATAFDESAFYVKKFNAKLGIKDFYGSDKYKWKNLDKTKFPELSIKYKDNNDAKADLLKKLDDKKRIVQKDYQDRALSLTQKTIETHLSGKAKYKNRFKYADKISDILKNPDEVWLKSKGKNTGNTYNYIKFYNDEMVVVIVDVIVGEPMRVKTWFNFKDETSYRTGILIRKMK